jgi:hypothetical protein
MPRRMSLQMLCLAMAATQSITPRAALAISTTSPQDDRLAAEQQDYDRAPDAVARAKALARLEPDVFKKAHETLLAGDDVGSLAQIERYRDETKTTITSLQAISGNASDHPAGFKELQIALREAVREMDGILLDLPEDKQPWFRAVRADLVDSQNQLIDLLFPRRPLKQKKAPPS